MNHSVLFCCFVVVIVSLCHPALAQREPIILEYADSLVGSGGPGYGIREFWGNVRFRHGNVTVSCDHAIHNPALNSVMLRGRAVIRQQDLRIEAPEAKYDGNTSIATAWGGIAVFDGNRTIRSRSGDYAMKSTIGVFRDSVVAWNDSGVVWSDIAWLNRSTNRTTASGHVVLIDTLSRFIASADSLDNNLQARYSRLIGNSTAWTWKEGGSDTMQIDADTLNRSMADNRIAARGRASILGASVAARGNSISYAAADSVITIEHDPVIWADSSQLYAHIITLHILHQHLDRVVGTGEAFLVSRTDTLRPDRYNQVAGDYITLLFTDAELRELIAVGNARSITFGGEQENGDGVALFQADTIKAYTRDNELSDVFWLGAVEGEHHPEPVIQQKTEPYRLTDFRWRTDVPVSKPLPRPILELKHRRVTGTPPLLNGTAAERK